MWHRKEEHSANNIAVHRYIEIFEGSYRGETHLKIVCPKSSCLARQPSSYSIRSILLRAA